MHAVTASTGPWPPSPTTPSDPAATPVPGPPESGPPEGPRPEPAARFPVGGGPRGNAIAAWVVILAMASLVVVGHRLVPVDAGPGPDDAAALALAEMQARYAVGVGDLLGAGSEALFRQVEILESGSVGQRLRFVILAAELAGPREARLRLDGLQKDLLAASGVELVPEQQEILEILQDLYPPALRDLDASQARTLAAEAAQDLDPTRRDKLVDGLGWFGRLAAAPEGTQDTAARDEALRSARSVALVIVLAAVCGLLAGTGGLAVLVVLIVLAATRRIGSAMGAARPHHAIYAETFAVWLVLFAGLQVAAILGSPPGLEMIATFAVFFASLLALGWPVLRGIPWVTVRRDIGWNLGREPWMEAMAGIGAYLATLPLLAAGLLAVIGLMFIQSAFAGPPAPFEPTGPPAHPIIVDMTGERLWPKLQVLFLGAVAAPIVEETMFRGVLYRHLRDATARSGLSVSVLVSTTAVGFVFAAIHPQGLVAIPALMALAYGMSLVREWRGTLLPSMVLHAVSNGLVMLLVILAFA